MCQLIIILFLGRYKWIAVWDKLLLLYLLLVASEFGQLDALGVDAVCALGYVLDQRWIVVILEGISSLVGL